MRCNKCEGYMKPTKRVAEDIHRCLKCGNIMLSSNDENNIGKY